MKLMHENIKQDGRFKEEKKEKLGTKKLKLSKPLLVKRNQNSNYKKQNKHILKKNVYSRIKKSTIETKYLRISLYPWGDLENKIGSS